MVLRHLFLQMNTQRRFSSQSPPCCEGYTIVEALVSMVLLSVSILPMAKLVSDLQFSSMARDKLVASQLAQSALEETIADRNYENRTLILLQNGKRWRVVFDFANLEGLIEIRVAISKIQSNTPLLVFKTLRFGEKQ